MKTFRKRIFEVGAELANKASIGIAYRSLLEQNRGDARNGAVRQRRMAKPLQKR